MYTMKDNCMIRVRGNTREALKKLGNKGDTYNIIISELIKGTCNRKIKLNSYKLSLQRIIKSYHIICQKCNNLRAFHVHHQDRNRKNNILENLKDLCKKCH